MLQLDSQKTDALKTLKSLRKKMTVLQNAIISRRKADDTEEKTQSFSNLYGKKKD